MVNRECPGREVSCLMFEAHVRRRPEYTLLRFGRGEPMILSVALTTRCRSFFPAAVQLEYHTVQQYVKVLSIVQR